MMTDDYNMATCYRCQNEWPAFALKTVTVLGQLVRLCPDCERDRQQLTLFYWDEGREK